MSSVIKMVVLALETTGYSDFGLDGDGFNLGLDHDLDFGGAGQF